jgi:iron complex outermembrane receptor protein
MAADQVREDRRGFQNFSAGALGVQGALRRDEGNQARTVDQFIQGDWALSPRWSASAGLRHSRVTLRSQDRFVAPGNPDDSGNTSFSATTPVAGLVFHATEHTNVYAAIGRGFETPTLNEIAYRPAGAPGLNFGLKEATSRQWELGVKHRIAQRWRVNAAWFQARTADEIVVLANAGGRSVFTNAADTRRRGLETSLSGAWGGGWSTHAAGTWIDARYGDAFGAGPGNRLPGVPRRSLFAELAWDHAATGLQAALEWRHVGRIAVDDANSDRAPASRSLNLRATWTQRVGRWTISEFVRVDNLTDRNSIGSVIVNEGNRRYFEPAPGRTWLAGVDVAYRF